MSRLNSQDDLIRALERRVLTGDLTAVRALARAYDRRDAGEETNPSDGIVAEIKALKKARILKGQDRQDITHAASPVFTDEAVVREAHRQRHADGEIEIDNNAELSVGDDAAVEGCYVQAWVWVDLSPTAMERLIAKHGREFFRE